MFGGEKFVGDDEIVLDNRERDYDNGYVGGNLNTNHIRNASAEINLEYYQEDEYRPIRPRNYVQENIGYAQEYLMMEATLLPADIGIALNLNENPFNDLQVQMPAPPMNIYGIE